MGLQNTCGIILRLQYKKLGRDSLKLPIPSQLVCQQQGYLQELIPDG